MLLPSSVALLPQIVMRGCAQALSLIIMESRTASRQVCETFSCIVEMSWQRIRQDSLPPAVNDSDYSGFPVAQTAIGFAFMSGFVPRS
ncbi:hypothetical protein BD769DRAFT_1073239 [Suillus cothurnatus]|nr:hypothetical protein BD769DRAFT_1073239 [Suillus cothurnatus]